MSDFQNYRKVLKSFEALSNEGRSKDSRHTRARVLRTRIWVESLLKDQNISRTELEDISYGIDRESTGTIMRWLKGRQIVNESTVKQIKYFDDNNHDVFSLPIFDLLESNISRTTVNSLLKKYTCEGPFGKAWNFDSLQRWPLRNNLYTVFSEQTEMLFQLGGVQGFLGILILLRQAELDRNSSYHFNYVKDAYRALPSFCRIPYFKKHWKTILKLLWNIHTHMDTSRMLIQPRVDIIRKQIYAKNHFTMREEWPRSPTDFRFIEPEHPYDTPTFSQRTMTRKDYIFDQG